MAQLITRCQQLVDRLASRSHCTNGIQSLRLNHYIWLAFISIPLCLIFITKNVLIANYSIAIGVSIFLICMITSLFFIPKVKSIQQIYHANNLIYFSMLILISTLGNNSNGQILWCYTYPLLNIFLFGHRAGVKWSLFLLASVIVSLNLNTCHYAINFQFRFSIIYLTILTITMWLESSRSRYIKQCSQTNSQLKKERESLNKEIARRSELEKKLNKLANLDDLTGIYNRRHFLLCTKNEISRGQRYNIPMAMALIDIDKFKRVNDTYGHPSGDKVLKDFAKLCKSFFRESDIYGRIGGEEFAILLFHVSAKQAQQIMDNFRQKVSEHLCHIQNNKITITISIGLAIANEKLHCAECLYAAADNALYTAKHKGRNTVEVN